LKLAKGHAAYETSLLLGGPDSLEFAPLCLMTTGSRAAFESAGNEPRTWPEIGTRGFIRAAGRTVDSCRLSGDWVIVQSDRYRYAVEEGDDVRVRMVISEYLACDVRWT
jgi:hypothetical protein